MDAPARNPGLDALRGASILLVVLHHLALRIPLSKTPLGDLVPKAITRALSYNGYEAVFVFFVISGFLITSHSLARWGELTRIDLRGFYGRRAARILPSLLLLLAVLSALHLARVPYYVIERRDQSLAGALVAALGLHLNWYEGRTGWLPGGWDVLWSLSIEETFYLGFPLACRAIRSRALWVSALAALALSAPLTRGALAGNEIWQEKAYLPGMSAIAAGVLTALVAAQRALPARTARLLIAGGGLGLGAVLVFGREVSLAFGEGYMLLLIGSAAWLVLGLHATRAGGARALGWLRAWGRLSYEIYLTHMFVVFAIVARFTADGGDPRRGLIWYVPLLLGTYALGWAFARLWSEPCEHALRARLLGPAAHNT